MLKGKDVCKQLQRMSGRLKKLDLNITDMGDVCKHALLL